MSHNSLSLSQANRDWQCQAANISRCLFCTASRTDCFLQIWHICRYSFSLFCCATLHDQTNPKEMYAASLLTLFLLFKIRAWYFFHSCWITFFGHLNCASFESCSHGDALSFSLLDFSLPLMASPHILCFSLVDGSYFYWT